MAQSKESPSKKDTSRVTAAAYLIRFLQIAVLLWLLLGWRFFWWPFDRHVVIKELIDVLTFSSDRYISGVLRLLFIAFPLFIIFSLINHVITGRWLLKIGKEGINIDDDRRTIEETIKANLNAESKYAASTQKVDELEDYVKDLERMLEESEKGSEELEVALEDSQVNGEALATELAAAKEEINRLTSMGKKADENIRPK